MGSGEKYSLIQNVNVPVSFSVGYDGEVFQCDRYGVGWKCDHRTRVVVIGLSWGGKLV